MGRKPDFDEYSELSHLYRTAPIGLCLMGADLRVVRINERLAAINGRSVEEHIGRTPHELIPEIADQVEAAYRRVLETGEPLVDVEVHGETPGCPGETRTWVVGYHPLNAPDGTILGVTSVVLDVTERTRAEREVADHRDHLEELVKQRTSELEEVHFRAQRAERLASIGTFASGIAHQINNPLGGILLAAQSAQISVGDPGVIDTALEDIVTDVKRCGRVVRSLLMFAREEAVRKLPGDFNAVVRAAGLQSRRHADECGVTIDLELSGSLPPVELSATALTEVIVIVIANAIHSGASRVVLTTLSDGEFVRLHITDNGGGISRDHQERVFDPFFTTRRGHGGSGLGLSIAHGVVAQHGGQIEIESESGSGTTVTIEFPRVPREADQVAQAAAPGFSEARHPRLRRDSVQRIERSIDRKSDFDEYSELSHLYRIAPVGLVLLDNDLRILRINELLAAIDGKSVEEHIGKTLQDIIPDFADQVEVGYRQVLETGEPLIGVKVLGTSPGHPNERRSWLIDRHPLKAPDGTILGVTGVVRDVTEEVRAENELAKYRDDLEELVKKRTLELEETHRRAQRAERLASIGTFAAGIAHQINNPLGGILLAAQSAQVSRGDREAVGSALEDIVNDVKRCGRVVRSLLMLTREESGRKQRVDLAAVVRAAVLQSRKYADECGVTIDSELTESLPPVELSATALVEVIVIVIANAIDAGASRVALTANSEGRFARLRVRDDGHGISPENQNRVFEPFFTTRHGQGGSGLGLSIARGVVVQRGGRIEIESEPGQGTTVTIELPRILGDRDANSSC